MRYDPRTGSAVAHEFGGGRLPDGAAFAPADDRPGGDGYLMAFVYDDDADVAAGPVATIAPPTRAPFGFHGNWLADPA